MSPPTSPSLPVQLGAPVDPDLNLNLNHWSPFFLFHVPFCLLQTVFFRV